MNDFQKKSQIVATQIVAHFVETGESPLIFHKRCKGYAFWSEVDEKVYGSQFSHYFMALGHERNWEEGFCFYPDLENAALEANLTLDWSEKGFPPDDCNSIAL